MQENEDEILHSSDAQRDELHEGQAKRVNHMYKNWFVEYASYVILERAIPAIEDGLKPVQRRIMHALNEMDDGRFNKVANVIGATMAYHPHGDAAIGDALVNLGQKDLLLDTQGNWGDIRTGDSAAAPRYIETRLSNFAKEVVFNNKTTLWQQSYDGRKNEPVNLPVKFPLLLAQGVEGIAVGLSTKIMPHNFLELCEASIEILKGKKPVIFPDFPTGGLADFSAYNNGKRGGRIRCRARIEEKDKTTLSITEIPFGSTTGSLIESIIKANDSGKIKIKKVIDNTAAKVDIEIQLAPGVNTDIAINALFAFTDCEISIAPLACVIVDEKPMFLSVSEILEHNTKNTLNLLKQELEIELSELEDRWHFYSLEKIFIENRIYRKIEECETWEEVLQAIDKGLKPHVKHLKRVITEDDIVRLTEIRIKRISKFDSFKADELIRATEEHINEVQNHLDNLVNYAIDYYKNLIKKYGKGRERKTQIRTFDTIEANAVAVANIKVYGNLKEGFIGTGLKKEAYLFDCSDIDDIIAFRKDGKYMISKVNDKTFFGKDLIHAEVWKKNDERTTYNLIYYDGGGKRAMVKRFNATGLIRDKEYDMTMGTAGSEVLYFTVNPNGEAEKVTIFLSHMASARVKQFDYDFGTLAIKGKASQGNLLTRYPIRKIDLKEKGKSTLGGQKIWWDSEVGRLNQNENGAFLGEFLEDDKILVIYNDGRYELTGFELTNRYETDTIYLLCKFDAARVINCVYQDGKSKFHFVKRFLIETISTDKKFEFISEEKDSKLVCCSLVENAFVTVVSEDKKRNRTEWSFGFADFTDVKGWKALGSRLTTDTVKKVTLESERYEYPKPATNMIKPETEGQINLL